MKSDDLLELIGNFYDGVADADGWEKALRRLAIFSDSDAASIMLWSRADNMAAVGEQVGLPHELLTDYQAHYDKEDPARFFGDRVRRGEWYLDERELGREFIRKSPFYQDFLKRYELDSTMVTPVLRGGRFDGFLSLSARAGKRDQSEVVHRLAPLLPHLERASSLRVRLLGVAQQQELSSWVLDRINFPLLVVTCEKNVTLANALGQQWLSSPGNPLAASSPHASEFVHLLRTATGFNGPRRSASFSMPNANGSPMFVSAVPLPPPRSAWGEAMPQALVWINDPASEKPHSDDILRHRFGLSRAEIRVFHQIMKGLTIKEACIALNISEPTGRSHLKAIFAKTNVRRQSELQRLLSRFNIVS
ncbi:helix-turn-helix transcriptional regulator [Cupriavidus sp. WKF15]|uniref:helix-turn-helix transcriptional regulator n=1 Tax=Cupriavidus sp. WKF15 TaxID=3032282 RepID=UPI0023E3337F|nr:helix-turn-helix transcriptional regulator [Cupriavidus sp. WKF15]WER48203.1 helix-turn-helix transcriptional regulator [Cupriavidus sp. WKF15]